MKHKNMYDNKSKNLKHIVADDLQYLQEKIAGRSVYNNLQRLYTRKPKHKKALYQI